MPTTSSVKDVTIQVLQSGGELETKVRHMIVQVRSCSCSYFVCHGRVGGSLQRLPGAVVKSSSLHRITARAESNRVVGWRYETRW